jgi:SagB-type dehydrogenase family enzyme
MARVLPIVAAIAGAAASLTLRDDRTLRGGGTTVPADDAALTLPLPDVAGGGGLPLEHALARRRSIRSFAPGELGREETSHLLWAAQGITEAATGRRTAPSAGALYPLELSIVTSDGIFRYLPTSHALERVLARDDRKALAHASLEQDAVAEAAVDVVIAAVPERSAVKYGDRAERYLLLEAGHVAQNLLLEATSLGLGAVPIGAFDDDAVARVVRLRSGERPLYIVAVGRLER